MRALAPAMLVAAIGCGGDADKLEKRIADLEARTDRVQSSIGRITKDAPEEGDTLQKAAARHDLLATILNYQDSTKTNWWCGPFICFRDRELCQAFENGYAGGAKPEECLGRRNVFCRGIGLPLLGTGSATGRPDLAQVMTCHATLSDCSTYEKQHGGPCLGVE